jgi:DNA-binding NarL/FixJ family response regulator/Flp pilus assembly protein TadD
VSDLERLSVLVIESHPGMRTQLRDMLSSMEIQRVQFAVSAAIAIRKLRDTRFNVVLCEYHLGEGQDGQHLLEDLRTHDIIPLETLFIMLTGERQYEKVIGAAELIPNDYILKPFAAETLHTRLDRALVKRDAFMPVYRVIEAGDLPEAIRLCAESETVHPDYAFDFVRLRADLHLQMGHVDKAQAVYRAATEIRPLPWMRLGLAKTLFMEKRYAEAEELLLSLIEQNRHYLDAYEWLAKTREMGGRMDEARKALLQATTLSPNRLTRLRRVGELSLSVGDPITAERMLTQVVRKSKQSDFREQEDYVHLVRAQLDNGKLEEAANTLDELTRSMPNDPKTRLCGAVAQSHLLIRKGDPEKARHVLSTGLKEYRNVGELSAVLKRELVRTCFENRLEAEAQEIVLDILRNAPDEKTIEYTRTLMREQGRTEMSSELEQRIQAEVRGLVAAGARLAQSGDFDGAVREMLTAVRKMPGNTHVLFNASLALLRHIEHHGWNESFATQARNLIQQARKRDPYNTRFAALTDFLHDLRVRQHQATRPGHGY